MNPTDQGEWQVFHPDEFLAVFLIQLPDPLPIEDGGKLPTHWRRYFNDEAEVLDTVADDLILQRIGAGEPRVLPYRLIEDRQEGAPVPLWNKHLLGASVMCHQVYSEAALESQREGPMKLARLLSRTGAEVREGAFISPQEKRNTLDAPGVGSSMGASELRDMGIGMTMVAECVVSLRCVGELPQLPGVMVLDHVAWESRDASSVQGIVDGELRWAAPYDAGTLGSDGITDRLHAGLDIVVAEIRAWQQALFISEGVAMPLLTRQRLPAVIPTLLRRTVPDEDEPAPAQIMLVNPVSVSRIVQATALTSQQLDRLNGARYTADDGAFSTHMDLLREANVALSITGDYRLAAILLGVAAETLLDELVLHLQWEEAMTPEQAAAGWRGEDGVTARVRRELPHRLGANWDLKSRTPAGIWIQDTADLRNRVAHSGYTPTASEARQSRDAVNQLVSFICDRLADPTILKSFPRTALALAGEPGLKKRGATDKKLAAIRTSLPDGPGDEVFLRWRDAWQRLRRDRLTPRAPDIKTAELWLVLHSDGKQNWYRRDSQSKLLIEVQLVENEGASEARTRAEGLARRRQSEAPDESASVRFTDEVPTVAIVGGDWMEEYGLLPRADVMVDGSDRI